MTVIVSNTDSLMAVDQINLIRGNLTRESFDSKFATYRENFKTNLVSKINRYLREISEDDRTGDATSDEIDLPDIYNLGTVVSVIAPTTKFFSYFQY